VSEAESPHAPVLLYDGVCGICNRGVRSILRLDRDGILRFAALDGDFARAIIDRHPHLRGVDSFVFVDAPGHPEEKVTARSAAALRVADYLGGPWKLLRIAHLIPAPMRDWLYDQVASNRYRIFGKYDTCPIPTAEVQARFLDTAS
jgi:predicted DCC family thiol-disulfide oxidoreductase YuxK